MSPPIEGRTMAQPVCIEIVAESQDSNRGTIRKKRKKEESEKKKKVKKKKKANENDNENDNEELTNRRTITNNK